MHCPTMVNYEDIKGIDISISRKYFGDIGLEAGVSHAQAFIICSSSVPRRHSCSSCFGENSSHGLFKYFLKQLQKIAF